MGIRIFTFFMVAMLLADSARGGEAGEEKNNELGRLDAAVILARTRVRKAWRLRAGDL